MIFKNLFYKKCKICGKKISKTDSEKNVLKCPNCDASYTIPPIFRFMLWIFNFIWIGGDIYVLFFLFYFIADKLQLFKAFDTGIGITLNLIVTFALYFFMPTSVMLIMPMTLIEKGDKTKNERDGLF